MDDHIISLNDLEVFLDWARTNLINPPDEAISVVQELEQIQIQMRDGAYPGEYVTLHVEDTDAIS